MPNFQMDVITYTWWDMLLPIGSDIFDQNLQFMLSDENGILYVCDVSRLNP